MLDKLCSGMSYSTANGEFSVYKATAESIQKMEE